MSEGYQRIESEHPAKVVNQVNKIAGILESNGGFRFTISQENLTSVIQLEAGTLTTAILQALHNLDLDDEATLTEVDTHVHTITVSLRQNQLH